MSLNRGEVNALNVFGVRKLSFIPNHFSKILVNLNINKQALMHWIDFNLNSRYAIVTKLTLDSNNKIITQMEIGIEDPKELTILALGCHLLYKKGN